MDDQWNVARRREPDGHVTIAFGGELDLNAAEDVRSVLHEAITQADGELVIDLTDVAFVDSSVLSAFAHARREAGEHDVSCRFSRPQDHVRRIIEIAGLQELLES